MGLAASKQLFERFFGFSRPTKILMVGLDAAGKTTVLYHLKLGELVNSIPTIGFNVETIKYKNLDMCVWDVGGQDKIRPLWKHGYEKSDAVIYVVDSNDPDRLAEARDELHKMLNADELRDARLLVLANKQDLPRSASPEKIVDALGLHSLRSRDWYLQPCSAARGEGLYEGLDWLSRALKNVARAA